jgi:hypothetical protein
LAQAVNVLNCILVVSGLNLGRDSNYRDWDFSCVSSVPLGHFRIVPRLDYVRFLHKSF